MALNLTSSMNSMTTATTSALSGIQDIFNQMNSDDAKNNPGTQAKLSFQAQMAQGWLQSLKSLVDVFASAAKTAEQPVRAQ